MKGIKKFVTVLLLGLIIFGIVGCQSSFQGKSDTNEKEKVSTEKLHNDAQLLDGSELDMSELGENEKYVVARTIYTNFKREQKYVNAQYKYNEYGERIKKVIYNKNGSKIKIKKWKYNNQGKKSMFIIDNTRSDNVIKEYAKYTYTYNDQGKKTSVKKKNKNNKIIEEIDYEYWENGNLKYKRIEKSNGSKKKTIYNKKGNPKHKTTISQNGQKEKVEYKYKYYSNNKKKKQIRKKIKNNKLVAEEVKSYDKEGNEIKYIEKKEGEIKFWFEKRYSQKNNLIKFITKNKKGKVKNWKEYEYNDKNKKIEIKRYWIRNGEKHLSSWQKYNYDNQGYYLFWERLTDNGKVICKGKNKFKKIKVERREK